GLVVVNIVSSADAQPVFLSEGNLRAMLSKTSELMVVEALPIGVYSQLVGGKIEQTFREAEALRSVLRTRYVSELSTEVTAFLALLDQLALLVEGYLLQRGAESVETPSIGALRDGLATSSFTFADNCRCMDDLHYEIVPALQALLRCFGDVVK